MNTKNCDECHSNPANIHLTQIVQNEVKVQHLCETCAKKMGISIVVEEEISHGNTEMPKIEKNQKAVKKEDLKVVCSNCRMSLAEFKQKGWLGCANCYAAFFKEIDSLLIQVHGTNEHKGKRYHKSQDPYLTSDNLTHLRDELQNAIRSEKFELAAVIRDKINNFSLPERSDDI